MMTMWMGIYLIVTADDCGLVESVQLPNSEQNIMLILSCDCMKHCCKVANLKYIRENMEAYR